MNEPIVFEKDLVLIYELKSYHVSDGVSFFERVCLSGKSAENLVEQLAEIKEFHYDMIKNNTGDCKIKIYLLKPYLKTCGPTRWPTGCNDELSADIIDVTDLYVSDTRRLVSQRFLQKELVSIEKEINILNQKKIKTEEQLNNIFSSKGLIVK